MCVACQCAFMPVCVCVCACVRAYCLPRRVLPELQATSAGGCSLITVINLATDRGRERQGAGGGGGGGGGCGGGGGLLQAGGGWRKAGEKGALRRWSVSSTHAHTYCV